jgi:hypothetical protein
VVSKTPTSVTYKHIDAADEGFPGHVIALVSVRVKIFLVRNFEC